MQDPRVQLSQAFASLRQRYPQFAPHADVVFEVQGELGRGGMGVVYRVQDARLGRQAALKVMHPQSQGDPNRAERFLREAQLTARLDHPGIPSIYEAGADAQGRLYMLMKVIQGEPLKARIKRLHEARGPLPARELRALLEVLVKVGEAVAYAHDQRVIHRDLKPQNVMVGSFGEVMVLDWGVAKRLDVQEEQVSALLSAKPVPDAEEGLTVDGATLGTPGYMAPEQACSENVDERADVFALGAILVEILTGSGPIQGATPMNKLTATMKGAVQLPRDLRPDAPAALNSLAREALRPSAGDRLPSAAAFVAELRAYLNDEPLTVHRYGLRERASRWVRRHPTALVGSSLGALALAAVVAGTVRVQRVEEARQTERAELQETVAQVESERETEAAQRQALEEALGILTRAEEQALRDPQGTRALIEKALRTADTRDVLWRAARIYREAKLWDESEAIVANRLLPQAARPHAELWFLHELEQDRQGRSPLEGEGEALAALQAVPADVEPDAYLHMARGIDHLRGGRHERALGEARQALKRSPEFGAAILLRGRALLEAGQAEQALPDLRVASEERPGDVQLRLLCARAYREAGQTHEAIRTLEVITEDPNLAARGEAMLALVRIHRESRMPAREEAGLGRLLRAVEEGKATLGREALALARGRRDELLKARGAPRGGGGKKPQPREDARGLERRAKRLLEERKFGKARRALGRLIKLEPSAPRHYMNRAMARSFLGEHEAALADCDRAIRLDPSAAGYAMRGNVRQAVGDLKGALDDWRHALVVDPSHPGARLNLGIGLEQTGDAAAAKAELERFVADHPGHPKAGAVRRKLEGMR